MAGLIADRAAWLELGEFLKSDLLVLDESARAAFSSQWQQLSEAEARLDDRILLGVIGGTGVGKSTLINALAGAEISTASDERPTTSGVIVYSHQSLALPDGVPTADIAQPLRRHQSAWLERVMVLDFPDFDSVEVPHYEIVQRFCPYLDVLVILVDDVKYGDERLFELARALPQSDKNLHIVLNKLDVLQERYPERWVGVVDEILADLRGKLREHAHLELAENRFLALSAHQAYERRRREGGAAEGSPAATANGDGFHAFEMVLREFQAERRRRAAKELNLEARQNRLLRDLESAVSSAQHERVGEAGATLTSRTRELTRMLDLLAGSVLSGDERRRMASERLRSRTDLLGFPLDFFLTLKGVFRWRKRASRRTTLSAERLRSHFRPYLDAVQNVQGDLQLELGEILTLIDDGPSKPKNVFLRAVGELGERTAEWEARLKKRWRIWNHLLPLCVLLGSLLSLIRPALKTAVTSWADGNEIPWAEVGSDVLVGLVAGLNPIFLIGVALGILLAYAAVAMVLWTRQLQRLERTFQEAERSAGEAVREMGEKRLAAMRERFERWLAERDELSELLERASGEKG